MNEQFKPFDRVLVRQKEEYEWSIDLFDCYKANTDYPYRCLRGHWKHCIPYDGNENLIGTTDSQKPKRWRAKINEHYWFIDLMLCPIKATEKNISFDDDMYAICNYFQTRKEAELMAEKIRKILNDE